MNEGIKEIATGIIYFHWNSCYFLRKHYLFSSHVPFVGLGYQW